MQLGPWLQPPRRALGVFLAITLGLAGGLTWLGWRVVALDRDLELQRTQERLGHVLDLVAVSLDSWLREVGGELATLAAAPDATGLEGRDAGMAEADAPVFLLLTGTELHAVPSGRLAYYPEGISERSPTSNGSSSQTTGAATLFEQAALQHKSGRYEAALAAYDQLAALPDTLPLLDVPASIVARDARALILEARGRRQDLRDEGARLEAAVRDPRHRLTSGVYSFYGDRARRWIGREDADPAGDAVESARLARSAVASDVVETWRRDPGPVAELVCRTVRVSEARQPGGSRAGTPMVVVERRGSDRLAAFVAPARLLEKRIREAIGPDAHRVALSILDASGEVIVGPPLTSAPQRVTRLAHDGSVPWTLTAAPGPGWLPDAQAWSRQRLVAIGVLIVAVAVVAAAWMAGRSMHREMEAARLQSEFVAAVSHEFRTPLAAFGQITELLADGRVASEADRDEYYGRLQHETRRLGRLVEDLLDFRRMEAGAHPYRFEPVEIEPLVRDLVDECQPNHDDSGPKLEFEAGNSCGLVRADREALARAIRNLIDNALKYAAGTPSVRVVASQAGDDVSIAVHDTGPGIAPEHQRRIFDKFVRAGAQENAVRGTGLGLAMVRHIVAAHGGRISRFLGRRPSAVDARRPVSAVQSLRRRSRLADHARPGQRRCRRARRRELRHGGAPRAGHPYGPQQLQRTRREPGRVSARRQHAGRAQVRGVGSRCPALDAVAVRGAQGPAATRDVSRRPQAGSEPVSVGMVSNRAT